MSNYNSIKKLKNNTIFSEIQINDIFKSTFQCFKRFFIAQIVVAHCNQLLQKVCCMRNHWNTNSNFYYIFHRFNFFPIKNIFFIFYFFTFTFNRFNICFNIFYVIITIIIAIIYFIIVENFNGIVIVIVVDGD